MRKKRITWQEAEKLKGELAAKGITKSSQLFPKKKKLNIYKSTRKMKKTCDIFGKEISVYNIVHMESIMKKTYNVRSKPMTTSVPSLAEYDKDFFKWTQHQASLMRKGNLDKLDIENLIEEIESLGRSDKRSLRSYIVVLLSHLLKKEYQPEGQGNSRSWEKSIFNSCKSIKNLLKESPSLKKVFNEIFNECYEDARTIASVETGIVVDDFPKECPWSKEEILKF